MPQYNFDWAAVERKRRSWTPNNPFPNSETVTQPLVISKCLALTALEPLVGEFIKTGLDSKDIHKIGKDAINTLTLNVIDEEVHELGLTRSRIALTNYDSSVETVANQLIAAWADLEDNPICTTAVLETSVFIPMLVLYSRFGAVSLRVLSQDISNDERRHANANRAVTMMLGARPSKKLMSLRKETIAWIGEDLNCEGFTQERLLKNSDLLLQRGVSDFVESAEGQVNAPFEILGTQMSAYK